VKHLLALILLVLLGPAQACTSTEWNSDHKKVHFGGEALVTLIGAQVTQSMPAGIAIGVGVGLAREIYKVHHGGQCEWSSMAWDAAGIALGATAAHWLVFNDGRTTTVAYATRF
jgi:hypothetical protein